MKHEVSLISKMIAGLMGEDAHTLHLPDHLIMLAFLTLVFAVLLPLLRRSFSYEDPGKIQQGLEVLIVTLRDSLKNIVGYRGTAFLGVVGTFMFVIGFSNLAGLVPGLQPPTANINVTFGLAFAAFLYYNFQGLAESGPRYFLQFLGPVWWLIPIFLPVEIISHLARILSLTIRLFGNIFGEHTASGIIFGLVPFTLPLAMLGLGVFGSVIQTLIFVVLTMVYLGGAVSGEAH